MIGACSRCGMRDWAPVRHLSRISDLGEKLLGEPRQLRIPRLLGQLPAFSGPVSSQIASIRAPQQTISELARYSPWNRPMEPAERVYNEPVMEAVAPLLSPCDR